MGQLREGGLRPTRREATIIRRKDFLMAYGPLRSLFLIGALAALIIGLIPTLWLQVNALIGFLATSGQPYRPFNPAPLSSVLVLLPDLLMLSLFGAVLAYYRMLSIQKNRFYIMGTPWGLMRLGMDDLIGLVVGTPLVWFIYHRHGYGILFFITGAQLLLFPFLGWMLAKVWESIYALLIRKLIIIPFDIEIAMTVKRTLQIHPPTAELFRVDSVAVDQENGSLTIRGSGSDAFRWEKGDQRLRELVRNIPIVTHNVKQIHILDGGARDA